MKRRGESDDDQAQIIWLTQEDIKLLRELISSQANLYDSTLQMLVRNAGQGYGAQDHVSINSALGQTEGFELTEDAVYESSAEEDDGGEELAEEFDDDALYIDQTAEEIVGGALDGLLDEVIGEISAQCSVDPQVARWIITDDAGFMESLEAVRNAAIADAKEQIRELLQNPAMVEDVDYG